MSHHHHQTETIHNGSHDVHHTGTSRPPEMTDREWSDYLYSHKNCWNPPYYTDNHSLDTQIQHNPFDTHGVALLTNGVAFLTHEVASITHTINNAFSGPSGLTTNL